MLNMNTTTVMLLNFWLFHLSMASNPPGVCGVALIGYILHVTSSWTLVFTIVFVVCAGGSLVFVVFGSGTPVVLSLDTNTR